jgi:hypothetical protein
MVFGVTFVVNAVCFPEFRPKWSMIRHVRFGPQPGILGAILHLRDLNP